MTKSFILQMFVKLMYYVGENDENTYTMIFNCNSNEYKNINVRDFMIMRSQLNELLQRSKNNIHKHDLRLENFY